MCEYVASTLFESSMNSTTAVDFLHYHRHSDDHLSSLSTSKLSEDADTLPSGNFFDVGKKNKEMLTIDPKNIPGYGAFSPGEEGRLKKKNAARVLRMLGPLWFEALSTEDDVHDKLWESMFNRMFDPEGRGDDEGAGGSRASTAGGRSSSGSSSGGEAWTGDAGETKYEIFSSF
jgi:hypothetical protein